MNDKRKDTQCDLHHSATAAIIIDHRIITITNARRPRVSMMCIVERPRIIHELWQVTSKWCPYCVRPCRLLPTIQKHKRFQRKTEKEKVCNRTTIEQQQRQQRLQDPDLTGNQPVNQSAIQQRIQKLESIHQLIAYQEASQSWRNQLWNKPKKRCRTNCSNWSKVCWC